MWTPASSPAPASSWRGGARSRGSQRPATRTSSGGGRLETGHLMRFYSMTKPVTSVAAMMLYEQGRFQLDDPVARFLPALRDLRVFVSGEGEGMRSEPARRPVTIHQLLTHTAGFTYGLDNDHPVSRLYREQRTDFYPTDGPLAEVVERLAELPLVHHPGERWNLRRRHRRAGTPRGGGLRPASRPLLRRAHPGTARHARHRVPGAAREARAPGPSLWTIEERRSRPARAGRSESLLRQRHHLRGRGRPHLHPRGTTSASPRC